MGLPSEAGELIVDLRRVGTFPYQRVVFGGLFVLLGLAVAGDPSAWPLLALYGGVVVITWLLLAFIASVRAVCERGVVVRRRWVQHVVPFADVVGLRQRQMADRGGRFIQTRVETERGSYALPRAFGPRSGSPEVVAAIHTIEQRANVTLAFALGRRA